MYAVGCTSAIFASVGLETVKSTMMGATESELIVIVLKDNIKRVKMDKSLCEIMSEYSDQELCKGVEALLKRRASGEKEYENDIVMLGAQVWDAKSLADAVLLEASKRYANRVRRVINKMATSV